MSKAKVRKKKGDSLKSSKIKNLMSQGNPAVSFHTKDARIKEKTGGKDSKVYSGEFHIVNNLFSGPELRPGRSLNPRVRVYSTRDLTASKAPGGLQIAGKKGVDEILNRAVGNYYMGGRFTGIKLGSETYTMKHERGTDAKGRATTTHYLSPINV